MGLFKKNMESVINTQREKAMGLAAKKGLH